MRGIIDEGSAASLGCNSGMPPHLRLKEVGSLDEAIDMLIPSANGYSNAASLARIAAVLAADGSLDGVRLMSPDTLRKATSTCCRVTGQFCVCICICFLTSCSFSFFSVEALPSAFDLLFRQNITYSVGGFGIDQVCTLLPSFSLYNIGPHCSCY